MHELVKAEADKRQADEDFLLCRLHKIKTYFSQKRTEMKNCRPSER